jgi:transcriptional regulator with XRE-family HTH domain
MKQRDKNNLIGELLRNYRKSSGLNSFQYAEMLGIPRSHMYRIEGGEDITVSTLNNICSKLNLVVTVEEL